MKALFAALGPVLVLGTIAATQGRTDVFVGSRDHPAIGYTATAPTDAVAELNRRLRDGAAALSHDVSRGYLPAVLRALDVPVESQSLVFSATSAQADRISMRHPRAIYFNDQTAVGWVPGADVLEIAAQDPRQGVMFYTLSQRRAAAPRFERQQDCLMCHLTWDTLGVPGMTVLSTFPMSDDPHAYASGVTVDHHTPMGDRWGGWYVTGQAPVANHFGNRPIVVPASQLPAAGPAPRFDRLDGQFDTAIYPTACSDIVALLVLEHQAQATNLLTRLGWEARIAAPGDGARVDAAVRDLVDYFLFVDEAPFERPVRGGCGFEQHFGALGPADSQGRSLRQFDLARRIFRYQCSYMIYSRAFAQLPASARAAVLLRMWRILAGHEQGALYKHLSRQDRQAVVEILRATLPETRAIFTGAIL